jgi:hypothetical protein
MCVRILTTIIVLLIVDPAELVIPLTFKLRRTIVRKGRAVPSGTRRAGTQQKAAENRENGLLDHIKPLVVEDWEF